MNISDGTKRFMKLLEFSDEQGASGFLRNKCEFETLGEYVLRTLDCWNARIGSCVERLPIQLLILMIQVSVTQILFRRA